MPGATKKRVLDISWKNKFKDKISNIFSETF